MKTSAITRKKILGLVVVLTIIGALVLRDFPQAGLVITLCALGIYFIYGIPSTIKCLGRFRTSNKTQRTRLIIMILMAGTIVSALMRGSVYYFMVLLLLALDYVLEDKQFSK